MPSFACPLILTQGDPAGIGPEIIVKAALEGTLAAWGDALLVAGDGAILQRAAALLGVAAERRPAANGEELLRLGSHGLRVRPLSQLDPQQTPFGQLRAANGRAMLDYIEWACAECRAGRAAGMVTAPIHKEAIHAAGCLFPGHTELLAERCGTEQVVMMLAGSRLRVCLVTTHLALRAVPAALTSAAILATIKVTAAALQRDFALPQPRLAVLALNPHAGENGLFGDEEQRLIVPAIERAQAAGLAVSGPHSADTLFHFAVQGRYDAVICMYHDQGLIPLKLLHFDDGVNVSLGLPIVRTSVDHGTAYDLAGSGRANPASLVAAVNMAAQMARNRQGLCAGGCQHAG